MFLLEIISYSTEPSWFIQNNIYDHVYVQFNPAKKAQLPKFADDLVKIIMEEEGGFGNS